MKAKAPTSPTGGTKPRGRRGHVITGEVDCRADCVSQLYRQHGGSQRDLLNTSLHFIGSRLHFDGDVFTLAQIWNLLNTEARVEVKVKYPVETAGLPDTGDVPVVTE